MQKKIMVTTGLIVVIGLLWLSSRQLITSPQYLALAFNASGEYDIELALAKQIFNLIYPILFAVLSLLAILVCSIDKLLIHR